MKVFLICLVAILAIVILLLSLNMKCQEYDFKKISDPKTEINLSQFIEIAKGKKIFTRLEVYYIPLSTNTLTPINEKDLVSSPNLKIMNDTIACSSCSYPFYFTEAFNDFTNKKQEEIPVDFRYCCVVYYGSEKIIRFSIARSNLANKSICINGIPYEASSDLIYKFLKLLPTVSYEEASKCIQG